MVDTGIDQLPTIRAEMPVPSTADNSVADLALAGVRHARDLILTRVFSTWLYRQTLRALVPERVVLKPIEVRPGRADRAEQLFQGRWYLPGARVRIEAASSPFVAVVPNSTWMEELHGFSWLRHFSAAGNDAARAYVRSLMMEWLARCGRWDPDAWQPQVTGRRLMSWLANAPLVIEGAGPIYRSQLLASMAQQLLHLSRTSHFGPLGEPRLTAAIGMTVASLCLPDRNTLIARGLARVSAELATQILPDGGHISRNPKAQFSILSDLVVLRDALVRRGHPVPKPVQDAIDRMMPMLRFFRHGDGRLTLFNGATEGADGAIDATLEFDDTRGKPFGHAPHSGYQRLAAGPSVIVVDTGVPPPGALSHETHAGSLSFEMSTGRARLIVNCGATQILGSEWESVSRSTAAHSTLVIEDTSSARLIRSPLARKFFGGRVMWGPAHVTTRRNESGDGTWIEASHDGYARLFGLIHRRRLFLSKSGEDFRGEDLVETIAGRRSRKNKALPFAVRFHLHPDARVSLAHDRMSVLVLLPNGDGWQFRAKVAGGPSELGIEESVYLGSGDAARRSEQIVVNGEIFRGEARINWAWRRLSTKGGPKNISAATALPVLPELEFD